MRWHLAAVLSMLVCTTVLAQNEFTAAFDAQDAGQWHLKRQVADTPSLTFPQAGEEPGLRFVSRGMDLLTRPWAVGTQPFEFSADVLVTENLTQSFERDRGVAITLSSAPVDRMQPGDWAVVFAITQSGVVATVRQGGARYAQPVPKRPGLWRFPGRDIAKRYVLTMGGAGGKNYSVPWPQRFDAGTRVRLHCWRDGEGMMRLTIYNADGVAGPWWEGQAKLPKALRDVPLKEVTVLTGRNSGEFGELDKTAINPGHADLLVHGIVQRIVGQVLQPGEQPKYHRPFPTAVSPAPANWKHQSALLDARQAEALRAKFNSPLFADYKTILLRNASPAKIGRSKTYGSAAQGEHLNALTWAYVLTRDESYLKRAIPEIDALSSVTDLMPAEQYGWPGHRKQFLNIQEFQCHNVEALAEAYDLLGEHLDKPRREHIRYLLVRALKQYQQLVKHHDWWWANNPSNTIGVGSGAMGVTAIILRRSHPKLADDVIEQALALIENRYDAIQADGSCVEGNLYWNYGMSYPLTFGWALRQTTGDDHGLLTNYRIRNAHQYMEMILGGNDQLIPFNDTQPWLTGWANCAAAGAAYHQPLMQWMADHMAHEFAHKHPWPEQDRARFAVNAFLLRDTRPAPPSFPGVPNLAMLEGVYEGVMRSDGSQYEPALVTAVKGKGAVSTHHAEMDQGSFVLDAYGEMLLIDPGYFEETAQDHSLSLIGKPDKMKLDVRAVCPISEVWEVGPLRSMTVDATAAYVKGRTQPAHVVEKVRRVFVQVGDQATVMLDDIALKRDGIAVITQYQAGQAVRLLAPSRAVVEGQQACVHIDTFGPALTLTSEARTFSKDWVYPKRGYKWHAISGTYELDADRPLVTVLTPSKIGAKVQPPRVTFGKDHIHVQLAGGGSVRFTRQANGNWEAIKP